MVWPVGPETLQQTIAVGTFGDDVGRGLGLRSGMRDFVDLTSESTGLREALVELQARQDAHARIVVGPQRRHAQAEPQPDLRRRGPSTWWRSGR